MRKKTLQLVALCFLPLTFIGFLLLAARYPSAVHGAAQTYGPIRRELRQSEIAVGTALVSGVPSVSFVRSNAIVSNGAVNGSNCPGCAQKPMAEALRTFSLNPQSLIDSAETNLYTGNAHWSLDLIDLPGRGLPLKLTLSYNSLIYSHDSDALYLLAPSSEPSVGFHLGLPEVSTVVGSSDLALIDEQGSVIQLQKGANGKYISTNTSGYSLDLTTSGAVLHRVNGELLELKKIGHRWLPVRIIDLAGNYISVTYKTSGQVETIEDTLGRLIVFSYDGTSHLVTIAKVSGEKTTTIAGFSYAQQQSLPVMENSREGAARPVVFAGLTNVTKPDGGSIMFSYDASGEITTITALAPNGATLHSVGMSYSAWSGEYGQVPRLVSRTNSYTNPQGSVVVSAKVTSPSLDGEGSIVWEDGHSTFATFGASGWEKGLVLEQTERAARASVRSSTATDKTTWAQAVLNGVTQTYKQSIVGSARSQGKPLHNTIIQFDQRGHETSYTEVAPNGKQIVKQELTYVDSETYDSLSVGNMVQRLTVTTPQIIRTTDFTYDQAALVEQKKVVHHLDHLDSNPQRLLAKPTGIMETCQGCIGANRAHSVTSITYNITGTKASMQKDSRPVVEWDFTDSFSDHQERNTMAFVTRTKIGNRVSRNTYQYDNGLVSSATNASGDSIEYTFDAANRLMTESNSAKKSYVHRFYGNDGTSEVTDLTTAKGVRSSIIARQGDGRVFATAIQKHENAKEYAAAVFLRNSKGHRYRRLSDAFVSEDWKTTRPSLMLERSFRPSNTSDASPSTASSSLADYLKAVNNAIEIPVSAQECWDNTYVLDNGEEYRTEDDSFFDTSDPGVDDSASDYSAWTSLSDTADAAAPLDSSFEADFEDETDQVTTASAQGQTSSDFQTKVTNEITAAGYSSVLASCTWTPGGYECSMSPSDASQFLTTVQQNSNEACGVLYGFHTDEAAGLGGMVDCRSFTGTYGDGSMQIVGSVNSGNFHIDVDQFNPYQDVVNFLGHAFIEVLPHLFGFKH